MYLGLDCGTSGLKAVLVDESGAAVAAASRAYLPDRPRAGWSEQDPEVWRAAMAGAIAELRALAPEAVGALKAIGFSGQMHGAVLIDRSDRPVRRAILHNDGRAHRGGGRACPRLSPSRRRRRREADARLHGAEAFVACTQRARTARPHRLRACAEGLFAAHPHRRARHGHERRGRPMVARRGGAPLVGGRDRRLRGRAEWTPRLHEGSDAVGKLRPAIAEELGLPPGVVVAAGGGDAAVGAVGLGAIAPGEAFISLGTATQLIVATERYLSAPERLVHSFAHALPGRWYAMAAMLNGAGALAFAARLLGSDARRARTRGGGRLPRARRARLPTLSLRRADAARRPLTRAACCSA